MIGTAVPLAEVPTDRHSVVTVGTFDGVHAGHQALLGYLVDRAKERRARSVVVTFDPHPREVVHGQIVPLLSTVHERARLMGDLGVDLVAVVPFTQQFASVSAEEFVRDILVGMIGMEEIVIGYDFSFGRGRQGNEALLRRIGDEEMFQVDVIPPHVIGARVVGSSGIRTLLLEVGDVKTASALLNRRYAFDATVVRGDGLGRTIGYPTANLKLIEPRKVIPRIGVYAVLVKIGSDEELPGMMSIGTRPTVNGKDLRLEVHLLDFNRDLYGSTITVEFVDRMRDEERFASVEELVEQLSKDENRCRAMLASLS